MKYYKILGGVHGNYLNVLVLPSTLCKPTLFVRIGMSDGAKKSGGRGEGYMAGGRAGVGLARIFLLARVA